jgi:hypothetical protein
MNEQSATNLDNSCQQPRRFQSTTACHSKQKTVAFSELKCKPSALSIPKMAEAQAAVGRFTDFHATGNQVIYRSNLKV